MNLSIILCTCIPSTYIALSNNTQMYKKKNNQPHKQTKQSQWGHRLFIHNVMSLTSHHTYTPAEEEISTGQQSHMSFKGKKLVVFEPGYLSCWSAVWRPAGDCNIFSFHHCHVCWLLDETPVHFCKHNTSITPNVGASLMCMCSSQSH